MKEITNEWLKAAYDDILVIEKIIDTDYLSHIVAFHAQQAIEKSFKAFMEEHDIEFRKIHNLVTLSSRIEPYLSWSIDIDLLRTLNSLYVDARYPGDFGLLPHGKPDHEHAQYFYQQAKDIYEFIKQKLH
jgi:HEPN domain-containing protein